MLYGIMMKKMGKVAALGFMIGLIGIPVACGPKSVKQEPAQTPKSSVAESAAPGLKRIKTIEVAQEGDSAVVSITGNRRLTYTSVKQPLPMGLVLYFPETGLDAQPTDISVRGDLVDSIKAVELIENGPTKVLIALNKDVPYRMSQERDGSVLKVSFSPSPWESSDAQAPAGNIEEQTISEESVPVRTESPAATPAISEKPVEKPVAVAVEKTSPVVALETDAKAVATRLNGVVANTATDFLKIHMQTDGRVLKYNHFKLTGPPRIVFDLYNLRVSETKMKTVAVNSKFAKSIRYLAYPDYVRVVIDTDDRYVNEYKTDSSAEGIYVYFGNAPSSAKETDSGSFKTTRVETEKQPPADSGRPLTAEADVVETKPVEMAVAEIETPVEPELATPVQDKGKVPDASIQAESGGGSAAWVKSIEFFSETNGESTLVIETTRPVTHDVKQIGSKQLELNLFNTRISLNRQRPIVTTRFESALDRILPVHDAALGRNSKVMIELREDVSYTEKKEENRLEIRFAASSVPPRPLEAAGLPDWKALLEKSKPASTADASASEIVPLEPIQAEVTDGSESGTGVQKLSVAAASGFEPIGEIPLDEEEVEGEGVVAKTGFIDLYSNKPKRYTGEKIALDFYQTDIKNVLRILRDVSGKNFAIDKDVSGMVTLSLVRPVPWDQVLDLILKMNNLGYMDEGDIIRIATLKTVEADEKRKQEALQARQAIKDREVMLEDLKTEYIPVSYSGAQNILSHVNAVLTTRGKTSVDARTNQIIITDVPTAIDQARIIVRRLDKVTPQVVIEARIVEVSDTYSKTLGSEWGIGGGPIYRNEVGGNYTWNVAMNHPGDMAERVGFNFARILGTPFSLNARLAAMESQGDGKIISTPRVLTLDNNKATITQGVEYPYMGVDSNGLATTMFKKVDLKLDVTPQVTPDNRINLEVNIDKNDISEITDAGPAMSTNSAKTVLLVNDGDTIVIGGILKSSNTTKEERMPWLNKIPGLGWLFKTRVQSASRNELLIFMTPRIVQLEQR